MRVRKPPDPTRPDTTRHDLTRELLDPARESGYDPRRALKINQPLHELFHLKVKKRKEKQWSSNTSIVAPSIQVNIPLLEHSTRSWSGVRSRCSPFRQQPGRSTAYRAPITAAVAAIIINIIVIIIARGEVFTDGHKIPTKKKRAKKRKRASNNNNNKMDEGITINMSVGCRIESLPRIENFDKSSCRPFDIYRMYRSCSSLSISRAPPVCFHLGRY